MSTEIWTPVAKTPETWTVVTPDPAIPDPNPPDPEPEPEPEPTPDYSAQYDLSDPNKSGFLYFTGWL